MGAEKSFSQEKNQVNQKYYKGRNHINNKRDGSFVKLHRLLF